MKKFFIICCLALVGGAALAAHHATPYPQAQLWSAIIGLCCFTAGRISASNS